MNNLYTGAGFNYIFLCLLCKLARLEYLEKKKAWHKVNVNKPAKITAKWKTGMWTNTSTRQPVFMLTVMKK